MTTVAHDSMTDRPTISAFDHLLRLSRSRFAEQHYEAAYHTLAAALYCARDLADNHRAERVAQEALRQMAWLDGHEPNHYLATKAARRRGMCPLWLTLADQAQTMGSVLERCHERQHDRPASHD